MSQELSNLTAVVTGGSSGIGAAIAAKLQAMGANISVLDLNPENLPAGQLGFTCNVADDDSVKAAITGTVEAFGGVDIVINNAGIGAIGTVETNDDAEWARVWDINVVGMVRVTRAALPHLRKSGAAAIVNTCSIAATAGLPARALYTATKGAVLSLTRAMAADHLREGVRVNAVNPGTADTPWIGRLMDQAENPVAERAALNARQPHGRLVSAEEVAGAVAYLASPLSGSTTGTSIAVDGGMQELRLRPAGQ
ncbi:oxidoreductase [Arthrobacter sp. PAMC 25486]|uniref:SDR family NAD(P)-dependent oxidoreductase n=1 Tax=Arthrobacter sp. PAMC 25486 TaxID=1494608 RepID=UPI00053643B4|nr:SDR family oxidoreductase [Arthrobacter sp. PAMC 25486]AIY02881.1 oxidoreductase [Arthrobacter sp. PAMC 25486]